MRLVFTEVDYAYTNMAGEEEIVSSAIGYRDRIDTREVP